MVMVPVVVEPKACLPKLRFFGATSSVDPAAEATGELTKKKAANTTTKRLMLSPSQNDVLARHSLRGSSVRVALESSIRRDRKASWAPRPESTRLLPTSGGRSGFDPRSHWDASNRSSRDACAVLVLAAHRPAVRRRWADPVPEPPN